MVDPKGKEENTRRPKRQKVQITKGNSKTTKSFPPGCIQRSHLKGVKPRVQKIAEGSTFNSNMKNKIGLSTTQTYRYALLLVCEAQCLNTDHCSQQHSLCQHNASVCIHTHL